MGMAASQARYLSLVARQSNVEYEGQQINQARTVLSNQSANLFNQMLGLSVPVPPSTQDYTTTQYSYNDGANDSVISSWQQLSSADPDYNYVVTHYYNAQQYTGSLKKLSDPQVQFSQPGSEPATDEEIRNATDKIADTYTDYVAATEDLKEAQEALATLSNYKDKTISVTESEYDEENDTYTLNGTDTYTAYDKLTDPTQQQAVEDAIEILETNGAISSDYDLSNVYYDSTNNRIAFKTDLEATETASALTPISLATYGTGSSGSIATQSQTLQSELDAAETAEKAAKAQYQQALDEYEALNHPTYVGNCELTPLTTLTKDQEAAIRQIVTDMNAQGIECNITDCYDTATGTYSGGIYTFTMNGQTYYTTLEDLSDSYMTGGGNNNIDGQQKLTYYNAAYIETKVEKTEKALLETDGSGRFTSVRFENDSVVYTLNMETITDEAAYEDAMNQYNYDNAVYDKTVRDINAKTSIIQQEDQQLELRLKQLDTERQALSTEIEAVQKVIKDSIESGFKTFNS